ncbi:MAG: SIR2 family protein [Pyrinomonadaceae bacterium]
MALRTRNAIIFLLGAGASYDADIPISSAMITKLETLVSNKNDADFGNDYALYYYIRSAINYGNEIKKLKRDSQVETFYNIESLVVSLEELAKKDDHHLYPFIGAWSPKLSELTDKNFDNIKKFKDKIVSKVRDWVEIKREEKTDYYKGLIGFHDDYEHPLRIFSLNYDLCVEIACNNLKGTYPERGFHPKRSVDGDTARKWDWQLLDENVVENESKSILLYKLHGSIDWKRHSDGQLTYEDSTANIAANETAIIFGTSYKLQYNDPFLYLFQEFRKWSLGAKLIIAIGYGFVDEHVNGILRQSLNSNPEMKLLWISPVFAPPNEIEEVQRQEIAKLEKSLSLNRQDGSQIIRWNFTAEEFMNNQLTIDKLETLFPQEEELFPQVKLEEDIESVNPSNLSSILMPYGENVDKS